MGTYYCTHCGKPFVPSKSQISKLRKNPNRRFFCSLVCAREYKKGKKISFQCETCGKMVTDYASNRPNARYCSWECKLKGQIKHKQVQTQCMQCGKPIVVREGKARAFCSYECYWEWRGHNMDMLAPPSQRVTKICEVCGNSFEVHRYRVDVARYCSVKCMHEARRKYPAEMKLESQLCACGCGGVIEPQFHHKYYGMPKYLHGHNPIYFPGFEKLLYKTPFQGIKQLRSSWEYLYAKWLDFTGQPWYYEYRVFDLGETTYLPDFYLPHLNEWHEVKGYMDETAHHKIELFRRMYPQERLVLIQEEEIKIIEQKLKEVG